MSEHLTPEARAEWREYAEWAAKGDSPWANIHQAECTLTLLDALDEAERERDEAREALARVEAVLGNVESDDLGGIAAELVYDLRLALAGPNPTDAEGDDRD